MRLWKMILGGPGKSWKIFMEKRVGTLVTAVAAATVSLKANVKKEKCMSVCVCLRMLWMSEKADSKLLSLISQLETF